MAVKRVKNQAARVRLFSAHKARVRRTAKQIRRGKLTLDQVADDLREFVDEELKRGP